MRTRLIFFIATFFCAFSGFSQTKVRPLPPNINRPSINLYAPFISGDGKTIIYLSDYTDDGHHSMRWATKRTVSTWNDGKEVTKLVNRPTLNYRGGYSLSFDGDQLLFTSRKSGIGGFDLWYSNLEGGSWSAPKNFGKPINSTGDEGAPMLSPDGEYLYFMQCSSIEEYAGATDCKIVVAKRKYNGWEEPVPLPDNINTGNSQTPRILADGETLIFASDKMGGKGKLDLFISSKTKTGWTDPIPLDFINTEGNDQFISIPAKGRYLYTDIDGIKDRELAEILIPKEFQPKKVLRVRGSIIDAATNEPVNANLTIFNIGMRDRLWNEKVGEDGDFAIVLKEGAAYDVSVDLDENNYMFYSKVYDLEEIGARDKENLKIVLKKLAQGEIYPLDIMFNENSAKLDDNSTFELRRISDLLKRKAGMNIEVEVNIHNYQEDSIASNPILTEVKMDTIYNNSISDHIKNESNAADSITDSLSINKPKMMIKHTYHNDRSLQQAEVIKNYIVERGIDENRITIKAIRNDNTKAEKPVEVTMKITSL